MKILHVINNLGSGGAEKLLEQLLPLMNEQEGVEVDLLLLTDHNNVFEESIRNKGVKVHILPLRKPKSPLNIFAIRKYILKGNYNIVHAHLFPTLYWVSLASKFMFPTNKPKFVYTEHSTHNRRRERPKLRKVEKWIYSSYHTIISISEPVQKNLISWLGHKKSDNFVVVHNGINLDIYKDALPYEKNQLIPGVNADAKILCMVGRFSEAKDHNTVIKAMQLLPENVHLVLVGEGPLLKECETLSIDLKISHRIHFLGFRNDVPRILKTSDVVIQSSHWEGFGLAAVEGMAAGKPVIGSNVPGLADIIGNKELLFEVGNEQILDRVITRLLINREDYNQVSRSCFIKSHSYDLIEVTDLHFDHYRSLRNA